jgi:hypothetical protein
MKPHDNSSQKPTADPAASASPGETAFAAFDYAVKVIKVSLVVLGAILVVTALSVVDMAYANQHEIFQYRFHAAAVLIVGYLLVDWLLGRRRARHAADATKTAAPDLQVRPKRGFAAELMALAFVAGGAAAFWHDHITHDIPKPVAVVGKFVSATCVDRAYRRIGGSISPHMSIAYEYPSQSSRPRDSGMKCFVDNCEFQKAPAPPMDTDAKQVFYASLAECQAALPNVLELKSPTTVWTGDKGPNATVRARFTPERDAPPYFLLWLPGGVAAVVLLASGFLRIRDGRRAG